ncbi:Uncharacterized protein OBRU01_16497 [Operophtera brumata]|uniref:Uncharacterized protein n=1 Tax=Operophtera brumata TaxID=104452 RepID=A0A0L7L2F2_OPEBR|nr:Uncharacterized protein OBRU01_16497 [Operophtera brumata]
MTETDATRRPIEMPERFIPYLEKYRIYKIFKHMKLFLSRQLHCFIDTDRVIILVSPELNIDLGFYVITRRCVMDRYEKHDEYVQGCISPVLMSEVTKEMTLKDPVPQAGWLMFDHPCTVREARCLQQDGVLPTVTLELIPTPSPAPLTPNPLTPPRDFSQQDFEVLQRGARMRGGGAGPAAGPPRSGRARHLPRADCGAARRGQAQPGARASQALRTVHFEDLLNEAKEQTDDIGETLRRHGPSLQLKADILTVAKISLQDCIDHGWVLTGYPTSGNEFERLDTMTTPPNRVVFLNADWETCKARTAMHGVDWCTGMSAPAGSGPRVLPHPKDEETQLDFEVHLHSLLGLIGPIVVFAIVCPA